MFFRGRGCAETIANLSCSLYKQEDINSCYSCDCCILFKIKTQFKDVLLYILPGAHILLSTLCCQSKYSFPYLELQCRQDSLVQKHPCLE
jgi:hypothetical protein